MAAHHLASAAMAAACEPARLTLLPHLTSKVLACVSLRRSQTNCKLSQESRLVQSLSVNAFSVRPSPQNQSFSSTSWPNFAEKSLCSRFSSAVFNRRLVICQSLNDTKEQEGLRAGGLQLVAYNEQITSSIAELLAKHVRAGDTICLQGPVGGGKTFFCRCFIRALANDPSLRVTSPTFTLLNVYDSDTDGITGPPVHHYDLYRLPPGADLQRLGWTSSQPHVVSLVEWPDRLCQLLPKERLDVHFFPKKWTPQRDELDDHQMYLEDTRERLVQLVGYGQRWKAVLELLRETTDSFDDF